MREPKRILEKLLGKEVDLAAFETTGESLELFIEVLREVVKCRRTRLWLLDTCGIDLAVSPAVFYRLLEIPQINFVETSNRMLDVETVSLKDNRTAEDPVTVGNLNSFLRELYRSLHEIAEIKQKEFPVLLLAGSMTEEQVTRMEEACRSLRSLRGRVTGYLLSCFRAAKIEKQFKETFPDANGAHPLRDRLERVEEELRFYKTCVKENRKWQAIGLDLFPLLKEDTLGNVMQNVQELGNLLWNLVYKHPKVKDSLALTGIEFGDIRPLFDPALVPVNNA